MESLNDEIEQLKDSEEVLKQKTEKLKSKFDAKEAELKSLLSRTSIDHGISESTLIEKSSSKVKVEKVRNQDKFEQGKKDLLYMNEELKKQKELEKAHQEKANSYESKLLEIKKLKSKLDLEKRDLNECQNQLKMNKQLLQKKMDRFANSATESNVDFDTKIKSRTKIVVDSDSSSGYYSSEDSEGFSVSSDELGYEAGSSSYYKYEKKVTTSKGGSGFKQEKAPKAKVVAKVDKSINLEKCTVAVLAGKCKDLRRPTNILGVIKPYIVLVVNDNKKKSAFNEDGSLSPSFKEKFMFKNVNLKKDRIIVEVRNKVLVQRQRFGISSLKFSEVFDLDNMEVGKNQVTKIIELDGEGNGKIMLKFIAFVQKM